MNRKRKTLHRMHPHPVKELYFLPVPTSEIATKEIATATAEMLFLRTALGTRMTPRGSGGRAEAARIQDQLDQWRSVQVSPGPGSDKSMDTGGTVRQPLDPQFDQFAPTCPILDAPLHTVFTDDHHTNVPDFDDVLRALNDLL